MNNGTFFNLSKDFQCPFVTNLFPNYHTTNHGPCLSVLFTKKHICTTCGWKNTAAGHTGQQYKLTHTSSIHSRILHTAGQNL